MKPLGPMVGDKMYGNGKWLRIWCYARSMPDHPGMWALMRNRLKWQVMP